MKKCLFKKSSFARYKPKYIQFTQSVKDKRNKYNRKISSKYIIYNQYLIKILELSMFKYITNIHF